MTDLADADSLESAAIVFALVLTRVSAFIVAGPVPSHTNSPNLLKVALCIVLSLFWYPQANLQVHNASMGFLAFSALGEFAIGYTLGSTVRLAFLPFTISGSYVAQELGFNLGQVTDPTTGSPSSETVLLFETIGVALFWMTNADHFVWKVLGGSMLYVEGSLDNVFEVGNLYTQLLAMCHELGILLVAPLAAIMWLILISLSLMMRIWPQITLFSFGMGARIILGLTALLWFFPQIVGGMDHAVKAISSTIENAILY